MFLNFLCLFASLYESKEVGEACNGEDVTDIVVHALDIDFSALFLCVLQDAKEDTQAG